MIGRKKPNPKPQKKKNYSFLTIKDKDTRPRDHIQNQETYKLRETVQSQYERHKTNTSLK